MYLKCAFVSYGLCLYLFIHVFVFGVQYLHVGAVLASYAAVFSVAHPLSGSKTKNGCVGG